MSRPITAIVLAAALALSLVTLVTALRLPGDNQGYEPVQPIAYSHKLHAGELQIQCQYCHSSADKSRHAGIPAMNVCMNCHSGVTATLAAVKAEEAAAAQEKRAAQPIRSSELQKLYDALALDKDLVPIADKTPTPIAWKRIHKLPDFVYFDHRAHITATVACQTCHGPIQEMERVRQYETLSMGWCVNCHRDVNEKGVNGKQVHASTDCTTCHY
jgi:cytochrome c7-like protein/class III cytochrome C family protein